MLTKCQLLSFNFTRWLTRVLRHAQFEIFQPSSLPCSAESFHQKSNGDRADDDQYDGEKKDDNGCLMILVT